MPIDNILCSLVVFAYIREQVSYCQGGNGTNERFFNLLLCAESSFLLILEVLIKKLTAKCFD